MVLKYSLLRRFSVNHTTLFPCPFRDNARPSNPLGRNTVRKVIFIQPKLANWNHFRAFWVHLVRAPVPRCGAPNMDRFPVQRDRWRKIFIGCVPNLQKNRNLSYWIAKNLCNVCTPQTSIFVKNWGSTKAKTPARTTSRSLTVGFSRFKVSIKYCIMQSTAISLKWMGTAVGS